MPAPDWLLAKPIAHRGLFNEARPENSLVAIDAAVSAGFPVEIDVQLTSDGHAVVFHDWNLKRLTGLDAKVKDVTIEKIRELTLLGTDQRIPTLEETLIVIAGRTPALVEIKNRRYPTRLEPVAGRILNAYKGPVAIQSFNPYTLGWFSLRYPRIARGQISCAFDTDDMADWKKQILSNYGMNWMSRPQFISHHWKQLPAVVPTFLRTTCKTPLIVWIIRNQEEIAMAKRLGDNYVFEQFIPA